MNKNKLSSWTLVGFVIFLLAGLAQISEPQFGGSILTIVGSLAIAAVLGVMTWKLRVAVNAEQAAAAEQRRQEEQRKNEEARRLWEEREARIKAERDRFRYVSFPVAGVTFQNEDKTDRQKILREIALNDDGVTAVSFQEEDDLGEESAIRVMTEYGCVGFIRRSDKAKIRRFFDRQTQRICLAVERFEADDGQKIYRADVNITMCRDDPDQQWYFDDLPES